MSVPAYVKTNARESAYLSKLTQQCLTIRQDVADAKRKPQKSNNESWGCLFILAIIISFIPSCTISLVMSSGDFGAFLIGTIIFSVGFGFFLVCSIQLDNSKEYEEWTPEKGAKKANNIAVKYNLTEKEYLLSVFNNIVKYDQQLEIATDSSEIINTINQINIFKRKVASVYQEVLTEEKSKSINRYSKSVMYNKILDGNYSASDHIRATKRIQAKETLRLEGFVIALAHLDRSLIWADELLLKFGK